ncbi:hypothetical protein [Quatrionicoccus australiensis]|uniref:hypothetical protein n=1 Tax=Quatrionicoccus australiensis TaxID=138118 RepID=UPI001CF8E52D|nr:hypothetical protein [Quatrionicoccus australiensis]UCV16566.1 hypothetical protein KI612_07670 [Quatrionicoccus australiensis]
MLEKTGCLLFALLLAARASAADVAVPENLVVGWIDSPDALAQVGYCVPDISPAKLEEIRGGAAKGSVVNYRRGADKTPYLIASGDRFACIDRNGNGKPLLPARLFSKMLSLEGASEQTANDLRLSLAQQVAQRGMADALVKFSNGNALEIMILVAEDAPVEFLYSTNFLKAGAYDESKYRFVASGPIKSFSSMAYGASSRRAVGILQDEPAPRPLRGEYLLAKGSSATGDYRFAGSTWRFNNGSSIYLAPGGNVSFRPTAGDEKTGSWTVDNGVLYFSYGQVYGSATLADGDKLAVDFRSPVSGPEKKERRWTARLDKGGF